MGVYWVLSCGHNSCCLIFLFSSLHICYPTTCVFNSLVFLCSEIGVNNIKASTNWNMGSVVEAPRAPPILDFSGQLQGNIFDSNLFTYYRFSQQRCRKALSAGSTHPFSMPRQRVLPAHQPWDFCRVARAYFHSMQVLLRSTSGREARARHEEEQVQSWLWATRLSNAWSEHRARKQGRHLFWRAFGSRKS